MQRRQFLLALLGISCAGGIAATATAAQAAETGTEVLPADVPLDPATLEGLNAKEMQYVVVRRRRYRPRRVVYYRPRRVYYRPRRVYYRVRPRVRRVRRVRW